VKQPVTIGGRPSRRRSTGTFHHRRRARSDSDRGRRHGLIPGIGTARRPAIHGLTPTGRARPNRRRRPGSDRHATGGTAPLTWNFERIDSPNPDAGAGITEVTPSTSASRRRSPMSATGREAHLHPSGATIRSLQVKDTRGHSATNARRGSSRYLPDGDFYTVPPDLPDARTRKRRVGPRRSKKRQRPGASDVVGVTRAARLSSRHCTVGGQPVTVTQTTAKAIAGVSGQLSQPARHQHRNCRRHDAGGEQRDVTRVERRQDSVAPDHSSSGTTHLVVDPWGVLAAVAPRARRSRGVRSARRLRRVQSLRREALALPAPNRLNTE